MSTASPLSLAQFQQGFAAGLLARGAVPEFGLDPLGFGVHANTVRTSLRTALEGAFPVVGRLVGAVFFATLADAFITARPPRLGWLSAYGAGLADFIAGYSPARELAYLADVARIEWARVHAAEAPDDPGLDLQALASVAPEALDGLSLGLSPAASLIRSPFPVFEIWRAHLPDESEDGLDRIDLASGPQSTLVTRLDALEIGVMALDPGDAALLAVAAEGGRLGLACQAALDAQPDYDLAEGLARLATLRALAGM